MSMKNRERLGRHALNNTNFGANATGSFPERSGSSAGLVTTSAQKYKRSSNSPLRGSRDGSMGAGQPSYTRSNFNARSGSASGYNGSAAGEAGRRVPGGMASRPPIPQHDNYVRQKSPKSPSSLRKKVGSRSPTRDVDMRDASHGLLTGHNQRVSVSPVRTASNEYLS